MQINNTPPAQSCSDLPPVKIGDRIVFVSISMIQPMRVNVRYGTVEKASETGSGIKYRQDDTGCSGCLNDIEYMHPHVAFGDTASVWGPIEKEQKLIEYCRDALIAKVHLTIARHYEALEYLRKIKTCQK